MIRKYILNQDGEPIPERSLDKWAMWFETAQRCVARAQVGDRLVSTIFLGLDHRYSRSGPPILWETMVFNAQGNPIDCERCAGTREQAEAMHAAMLIKLGSLK